MNFHVIVTGAAGHLGSRLVARLLESGLRVTGLDRAPGDFAAPNYAFQSLDLSDFAALKNALGGADLIVHCASLHPWKPYSDAQYFEANVVGTWNLYRAASELGIARAVMTSSIAAIGYAAPPAAWPVREEAMFDLSDLYSLTKHAQEDIARMFAAQNKVRTLALRPPAFFPLDVEQTAFWLTGAFLLVEDVVAAHVAAVKVLLGLQDAPPLAAFEPVFLMQQLPYTREDVALFEAAGSMLPLVEKHYPAAAPWLRARGFEGRGLAVVYDVSKAARLLGWRARYDVASWIAAHGAQEETT